MHVIRGRGGSDPQEKDGPQGAFPPHRMLFSRHLDQNGEELRCSPAASPGSSISVNSRSGPSSLPSCLQGAQTRLFAVSFTFTKGHREPDWCKALDPSSGALDKGKFPLRDPPGPSGLVWQGFSITTDCRMMGT